MFAQNFFPGLPAGSTMEVMYFDLLFVGAVIGYLSLILFVWFGWQYRRNPRGISALLGDDRRYEPTFRWLWVHGWKHGYFKMAVLVKLLLPTVVFGVCQARGDDYLAFVLPGIIVLALLGLSMIAHE